MCGECETWNNIIYSETEAVKLIIRQQNDHCNFSIAGFPGGSVVPGIGNVVGLAAGIIIGIGTAYLVDNDLTGDGKSLRDNIKDFVFGLIDGEYNDEKE